ncbi:chemotaxis protein CheD [Candidatus Margulisiibacteriota bacterium]
MRRVLFSEKIIKIFSIFIRYFNKMYSKIIIDRKPNNHTVIHKNSTGIKKIVFALDGDKVRQKYIFSSVFNNVMVSIGDLKVSKTHGEVLHTVLGCCVGVALWDPFIRIAGLLHYQIPDKSSTYKTTAPYLDAETGIPALIKNMEKKGCNRKNLITYLAGGAQIYAVLNGGRNNINAAYKYLKQENIRITHDRTGGTKGTSMYIEVATGICTVHHT